MVRILGNTRISAFKLFYLFCFIIYAGSATIFARSIGDISTIGNAFAVFLTLLFIIRYKVVFNRNYFYSIIVFSIYAGITFINNGLISPLWFSLWIFWLTFAYCISHSFRRKLFVAYESIILILSIISLPFWIILCIDYDTIYSLVSFFEFSSPYAENANTAVNMIVFSVMRKDIALIEFFLLPRNPGFAWEPGAFSSFIVLAIFCNSLRTNFRLKNNYSLLILSFTLITTQSTTGLAIFIVMILCWFVIRRKFKITFLLIPLILFLLNLPFVRDKIVNEYYDMQYVDISQLSQENSHSLGRFYSFKLDFEEFLRHPVLGLGGFVGGSYLRRTGYNNIATISGLGKLLSMYGLIMSVLFFFLLYSSAKTISKIFKLPNGYLLIVVIVGIMISYNIWTQPLIISFWMYSLYGKVLRHRNFKHIVVKRKINCSF